MLTEGGWQAGTASQLGVRDYHANGTSIGFPGGVAPFAAPLLMWVAGEIHSRVERLHDGYNWGHYYRYVRGAIGVMSDHAGAAAIDINAPYHPRGVHGTWSSGEIAEIRKILAEANSHGEVVIWGHDFHTTVDDMHFACRGTRQQVIDAGSRLNTPKDWFTMATQAELRTVVDRAIAAAIPEITSAVVLAISAKLDDSASPFATRVRKQVRAAVDAELTERHLGTVK
jgi:hypothetical protein